MCAIKVALCSLVTPIGLGGTRIQGFFLQEPIRTIRDSVIILVNAASGSQLEGLVEGFLSFNSSRRISPLLACLHVSLADFVDGPMFVE